MAKTEITKPSETGRSRDVFSAMRDEMDRVFGRVCLRCFAGKAP